MYRIQDCNEICDLCGKKNSGDNLRYFQNFLPNPSVIVTLCIRCSLKGWTLLSYFHVEERNGIKPTRKYKKRRKMGGAQGQSPLAKRKKRVKPTDLYCLNCLEETLSLKDSDHPNRLYYCERCKRSYTRGQVLTFDEMTKVKFARAKHKTERTVRK